MRITFSGLALLVLFGTILLSGVLNNVLSVGAAAMAVVCWLAASKAGRGATGIGLVAVCGWLLIAAVIATAFRG